jgi:hypothetical protein
MNLTKELQQLENDFNNLVIISLFLIILSFIFGLYAAYYSQKPKMKKKKKKKCLHLSKHTYVESATPGCETVKITCLACQKVLSTKTDCR